MSKFRRLVNAFLFRRLVKRWAALAERADITDLSRLRVQNNRAKLLRHHLDRVIAVADNRLALPAIGSDTFRQPRDSDWGWRPPLWREPVAHKGMASVPSKTEFAPGSTVFHDCSVSELTLRQLRNTREADLAPFGVRMDVFRFDGSFLSIAVDLPPEALRGLRRKHLIRMDTQIEIEKPLEIFARLNIKHGPNTEQIVREVPLQHGGEMMVEFDLGYTQIAENRLESAWVDLIFEGAQMNEVTIRDLTFCRLPRADI
ncbi:DUF6478 family protein [Donghicola mangrovi]|uniref:Uncharacterized protein n=1 Tax=Donghicola mangrovi TaxID=2729614 RepID=A0A850PZ71_9RHOB|nr:DUF6478 family protein [Donghicola mangrovi]NVO22034.1 hypothetical protein [Donghicola mangrovi]